ncbi:root hair defective 3 GTP-binding protein-domain-containing protein [Thamnocephalis sphaerospora]|uniref:Root hair defective 3 GTP-binding protein-domain-containing protein n=1 Tax=Thamnocephalis sphaerospora TaxID=78915 RepID=A0A4P9XID4_9FUNG|nr:root hair defective 3 GTP-binding protein-domain-containing protein [Thamnocephalis sphaerospora]|eukprot:RKP05445.1 root hair defective 3 GTP-binding protein-domain-containing protein [Thamnocephalis sphaerospora]
MTDSCLQLLDENQELVAGVEKLANERWNLENWGVDYNVVAICGQPGSGKSTLANALFGTQFLVLDNHGNQSTTEGVWISTASNARMLVMDTEIAAKTSDKEYWANRHRSSTFMVSTASVLVFNAQESSVNDNSGVKIHIALANICEAHLAMFGKRHKTIILFLVRDCSDDALKETLVSALNVLITDAWECVEKPDDLKDYAVGDIFDYDVVTLPSKIDAPDEFDAAVDRLRERFVDRRSLKYLFKPSYWKVVSADRIVPHLKDLCHAIENNWNVIAYETFSLDKIAPTLEAKKKYAAEKRCCLFEGQYSNHTKDFYDMAIHHTYNEFLVGIEPVLKEIDAKGIEDEYLKQLIVYRRNAMGKSGCRKLAMHTR